MKLTPCRLDVWSPRARASRGAGTTPADVIGGGPRSERSAPVGAR